MIGDHTSADDVPAFLLWGAVFGYIGLTGQALTRFRFRRHRVCLGLPEQGCCERDRSRPALALSEPVTPAIGDFQVNINGAVRPYPVLNTSDFVAAITAAISDPALRKLTAVGGIDQLTHADDALIHFTPWPEHLTWTYRTLLNTAAQTSA
jgi:hypothetical protein